MSTLTLQTKTLYLLDLVPSLGLPKVSVMIKEPDADMFPSLEELGVAVSEKFGYQAKVRFAYEADEFERVYVVEPV